MSPTVAQQTLPVFYEDRMNADRRWAMLEGSKHFEEESAVFKAMNNIARRLNTLNIPYAVVGGMALFQHGYRRFTDDVDLLVTQSDLAIIHEKLTGLGYLPPFAGSKQLRDTQLGVKIEFLITGTYPGDGKSKPVAFPDPRDVFIENEGIRYLNLETLLELKLASGMTGAGRRKDLSDVQEVIKKLNLPLEFCEKLNAFVRDQFRELWNEVHVPDYIPDSDFTGQQSNAN